MEKREGYKKTEIGWIPEEWDFSKVEECVEILDSRRVPLNQEDRNTRKGSIPYYGANGVVDYINAFIFDEPLVLMAEDGGYFQEASNRPICQKIDDKCWVNNHAHVLRNIPHLLNRDWLFYWFVNRDITPFINAGTRSKLNQSDLRKLPLPLPPLPEQKKIASILTTVDDKISSIDSQIQQTEQLKKGLMEKLLTEGIGHTEFKETEIGWIPEDWDVVKLPKASWFQEGPGLRNWQFTDEGIKVINITNMVDGFLDLSKTSRHISLDEFNKQYSHFECDENDIVIASSGNSYCKHALVRKIDLPLVMNTSVIRFKPINETDYDYLNQFLKSALLKKQIDILITGGAQPNFGPAHLKQIKFPYPPLPEQKKIASILSTVDGKIEVLTQKKTQYQTLKKGLSQQLLTGQMRVKI